MCACMRASFWIFECARLANGTCVCMCACVSGRASVFVFVVPEPVRTIEWEQSWCGYLMITQLSDKHNGTCSKHARVAYSSFKHVLTNTICTTSRQLESLLFGQRTYLVCSCFFGLSDCRQGSTVFSADKGSSQKVVHQNAKTHEHHLCSVLCNFFFVIPLANMLTSSNVYFLLFAALTDHIWQVELREQINRENTPVWWLL